MFAWPGIIARHSTRGCPCHCVPRCSADGPRTSPSGLSCTASCGGATALGRGGRSWPRSELTSSGPPPLLLGSPPPRLPCTKDPHLMAPCAMTRKMTRGVPFHLAQPGCAFPSGDIGGGEGGAAAAQAVPALLPALQPCVRGAPPRRFEPVSESLLCSIRPAHALLHTRSIDANVAQRRPSCDTTRPRLLLKLPRAPPVVHVKTPLLPGPASSAPPRFSRSWASSRECFGRSGGSGLSRAWACSRGGPWSSWTRSRGTTRTSRRRERAGAGGRASSLSHPRFHSSLPVSSSSGLPPHSERTRAKSRIHGRRKTS